jgi:hydrogenase maturation protein HypF
MMKNLSLHFITDPPPLHKRQLLAVKVRGLVQGVGFRPFVYRLAKDLGLKGYVLNGPQGVEIEVEGNIGALREFLRLLKDDKPPRAVLESVESTLLPPKNYPDFQIRESGEKGAKTVLILPDLALCPECLKDILDPQNRRYLYPFTNCTNCGPRFSIIERLPYDRPHTSMRQFMMCPECRWEYMDPSDRRFHAQPNACPLCGPQLEFWDGTGKVLVARQAALDQAVKVLRWGGILALKGLGGFQLLCDARNEKAVADLRARKRREAKPLAVMFPGLASLKAACQVNGAEEKLLLSTEAPIVLLKKNTPDAGLAASVAPGNPQLGAFLPYTPLHFILMDKLGFPVVATSGNLSDEPIVTDGAEALERLKGIADFFLTHNRPIVRPMDDSVARVVSGEVQVLRRARGYAPLPVLLAEEGPTVLALGGYLKNTVALAKEGRVFLSQHLGDLGTLPSLEAFEKSLTDLPRLYEAAPEAVACDLHPDYPSTRRAGEMNLPVIPVQHHMAHVFSVMAENHLEAPTLGVAWDGTGWGTDHTIWGGEFFAMDKSCVQRFAHLRPFPLIGGDKAAKESRRSALGILYALYRGESFGLDIPTLKAFVPQELSVLGKMLTFPEHTMTSSMGRLFDAVASLTGLCQRSRFEGEAAMALEFALGACDTKEAYPFPLVFHGQTGWLDWEPMVRQLLEDLENGEPLSVISRRFHNALVEGLLKVASKAGFEQVALSGGCFQNRVLAELSVTRLREKGFRPYWQKQVPPNDGGLSLGQAAYARWKMGKDK